MSYDIPPGLTSLLQDFTVAVLRNKPNDLYKFAAEYFTSDAILCKSETSKKIAFTGVTLSDDEGHAEPPKMMYRGRRKSVAAERYDPEADDDEGDLIVHKKSQLQEKRLKIAVKNILIFRALEEPQMKEVIQAMFERKVIVGEHVINEGEDGDNFYVIESGTYKIKVNNKIVGSYEGQGSFGELALMYNMPRAATITATSPGTLWALDRSTFRRIVLKSAFKRRKVYEGLLESVPLLNSLDKYERMNVADALVSKTFKHNELIIKQGDLASCMYFIEEGRVRITMKAKPSEPEKELTVVSKGGYFGELALVTHKPRAASAYAVEKVRCAVLDVAAFERVMGPCMDIMKRNIRMYDEQVKEIFGSEGTNSAARQNF